MTNYIRQTNQEAIRHFQSLNVELMPDVRNTYVCCAQCGEPVATIDVYYVGGRFREMTGNEFNRYLRENGILQHRPVWEE